jgi:plastocyanin
MAGGAVTWTTEGSLEHSVTAQDGSFDGMVIRDQPFTMTFNTPGVFSYTCTPHPWMKGSVTVLAGPPVNGAPGAEGSPEGEPAATE